MSKQYTEAELNQLYDFFEGIERTDEIDNALNAKTDAEIAHLVMLHVWADLMPFAPASILLMNAIKRLNGGGVDPGAESEGAE